MRLPCYTWVRIWVLAPHVDSTDTAVGLALLPLGYSDLSDYPLRLLLWGHPSGLYLYVQKESSLYLKNRYNYNYIINFSFSVSIIYLLMIFIYKKSLHLPGIGICPDAFPSPMMNFHMCSYYFFPSSFQCFFAIPTVYHNSPYWCLDSYYLLLLNVCLYCICSFQGISHLK